MSSKTEKNGGGRAPNYDCLIKLLLIGDQAVGKSCLLLRFSENQFQSNFISTIGIDFKVKTVELRGKKVKMQIWDTAGQERFRTITTAYYRGAMGVIVVYDVTKDSSFSNIRNWLRNIELHASPDIVKVLVGNKADMETRAIDAERAEKLAGEYQMKHFETSAKTGLNVEEMFTYVAEQILDRLDQASNRNRNDVGKSPLDLMVRPAAKKKGCCG